MTDRHADSVSDSSLTPVEARRIDRICDEFESAWKSGQRPKIENYVGESRESMRAELFRQLLLLDWDYRASGGETPHAGEYRTRFPGDESLVDDVAGEAEAAANSVGNTSALPAPYSTLHDAPSEACVPIDPPSQGGESSSERYEMLEQIGSGGIGVVYRANDRHLGRELAIKLLRETYRHLPEAVGRFLMEARVGSQLQHPAIVPVYDLSRWRDGSPLLTMKLVEGRTLGELLETRSDPPDDLQQLLNVFEQVCQAIAYAHARGVVHRDLKPANIMVGTFGEVQVMDWGFAKVLGEPKPGFPARSPAEEAADIEANANRPADDVAIASAGRAEITARSLRQSNCRPPASRAGALMGTPAYMPPEQARGDVGLISPATDVFSLGAILCEILTGRPPYVADAPTDMHRLALDGDLDDAHARIDACDADVDLRRLARRCLAREPSDRPKHGGELADALSAWRALAQQRLKTAELARASAQIREQAAAAKVRAERRARKLTLGLAASAVALLVLAAAGWAWREQVSHDESIRLAVADGKVEEAVLEADERIVRGDWRGGIVALTRAKDLIASGASERRLPRVSRMLDDLALLTRLDRIRSSAEYDRLTRRFPADKVAKRYAAAFASHGVDPSSSPTETAERIQRISAPVRDAIVAVLDHWWLIERDANASVGNWIADVLQRVDGAPWRIELRDAIVQKQLPRLVAIADEDRILSQPPSALTTLAHALLELEADDAAVAMLRRAQRRYPDDFWMNFDLGWALLRKRPVSNAEALRCFSVARLLRPDLAGVYLNVGSLLADGQDWEGAVFHARKAIERDAELASAYNLLGVGLAKTGKLGEATDAYRKALALDDNLAETYYNLGLLRQRQGRVDDALAAVERATHLAPEDSESWYVLGNVCYDKREYEKALDAYRRATRLNESFPMAHNNLGNTLKALGRVDDAIAAYKRAIQLGPQPELDKVFSNLGAAWHLKRRADLATSAYRAAVELKPDSAPNQYNLGSGLQSLGDWEAAASTYREVIRLDPDFAEAHCNLGHVLRRTGKLDEALEALERGHELGSRRDDWPYPSRKWIEQVRDLVRAAEFDM